MIRALITEHYGIIWLWFVGIAAAVSLLNPVFVKSVRACTERALLDGHEGQGRTVMDRLRAACRRPIAVLNGYVIATAEWLVPGARLRYMLIAAVLSGVYAAAGLLALWLLGPVIETLLAGIIFAAICLFFLWAVLSREPSGSGGQSRSSSDLGADEQAGGFGATKLTSAPGHTLARTTPPGSPRQYHGPGGPPYNEK